MATSALPIRVLLGVYLGVLTGLIPSLVAWGLAVIWRYVTGLAVPAFGVMVLAVAIAGVNGGLLALNDPSVLGSENNVTLVTAILVVMMMSFYAHDRGDRFAASLPRRLTFKALRDRTLSADVIERVGAVGRVRVRVVGTVGNIEGYPPLPRDLREDIAGSEHPFPADLSVSDLEARLADRLREEHDLADVSVTIDERARATVAAAPPLSGLSKRVPTGKRAVSVSALVPSGLAAGDDVVVALDGDRVTGTVVGVTSAPEGAGPQEETAGPPADDAAAATTDPHAETPTPAGEAAPATGGDGRVTLAVDRGDAQTLLRADRGAVVVTARGTTREYELVSLLRRAGQRIRRVTVRDGGPLDGATIGEADVRDRYGVAVLAVRHGGTWTFAPRGSTRLSGGDTLFTAGTVDAFERFGEAVST
ncbi:MAG: potassium channel family protein [Halobacteriaceae archaeon]